MGRFQSFSSADKKLPQHSPTTPSSRPQPQPLPHQYGHLLSLRRASRKAMLPLLDCEILQCRMPEGGLVLSPLFALCTAVGSRRPTATSTRRLQPDPHAMWRRFVFLHPAFRCPSSVQRHQRLQGQRPSHGIWVYRSWDGNAVL